MTVTKNKWADRPRAIEMGKPSQTERLAEWISKVHRKKQECYRSPKRDFRVQAVLTCSLHKARYELRAKQLKRMARWQRLKKTFLAGVEYGSCALYHTVEVERQKQLQARRDGDPWRTREMREELDSMDDFFQQLGEIKSFVIR